MHCIMSAYFSFPTYWSFHDNTSTDQESHYSDSSYYKKLNKNHLV